MRLTLLLIIFSVFSVFSQDLAPAPDVGSPSLSALQIAPAEIWDCGCGMETHYAGGGKALSAFVNDHIDLPSDINWGNTSLVRTYVEFIVEKDGSLSDIQIIHTNFPEANEYILSVFRNMTNWVAGEYRCETVRTNVRVPVLLEIR